MSKSYRPFPDPVACDTFFVPSWCAEETWSNKPNDSRQHGLSQQVSCPKLRNWSINTKTGWRSTVSICRSHGH